MIKNYVTAGAIIFYAVLIAFIISLSSCGEGGALAVKNGYSSLIELIPAEIDKNICLSERGYLVYTGLDLDNSKSLEGEEISKIQILCHGANGQDGADAPPTEYTFVDIIDPCGDALNIVDEVLFVMTNGSIVASFSQTVGGTNTRLVILSEGTYQTTDGSNCVFQVLEDNTVVW